MIRICADKLTLDDKARIEALFILLGSDSLVYSDSSDTPETGGLPLVVIGEKTRTKLNASHPELTYTFFETVNDMFAETGRERLRMLLDRLDLKLSAIYDGNYPDIGEFNSSPIILYGTNNKIKIYPDDKFPTQPSATDLSFSDFKNLSKLKAIIGNVPIGIITKPS